jgi:hypothetical protein
VQTVPGATNTRNPLADASGQCATVRPQTSGSSFTGELHAADSRKSKLQSPSDRYGNQPRGEDPPIRAVGSSNHDAAYLGCAHRRHSMLRIYAGNLPADTTEREFNELFAEYGRVRSIELARDIFSGRCRGFGFVEMEGHEARAAIAGLNGRNLRGNSLRVNQERPRDRNGRGRRR